MDSGNSGSISSSGDEEYDSSRADHTHTLLPSTFLNHHPTPTPTQFGNSISHSHPQQSNSLVSSSHHQTHHQHHHSNLFDLSSTYFHALSQSQPNSSNPNSLLNLDTAATNTISQGPRSEPNCTDPARASLLQGVSSSSSPPGMNQCLFPPHGLGQCATDDNNNARVVSSSTNAARNSKKRTRASRRAPTTVLTTDTSNFRAMVQEFTGIPAPPFSASSYSYPRNRRLDLLTASSSSSFYPLRPSPQKHLHHPNPFILSSSSSPSPSTLHNNNNNNMVDAIASTTYNNSSSKNPVNYQNDTTDLQPHLGLPYHHPQNIMLNMQNQSHPILAFHHAPPLHPALGNHVFAGFGAKSQASLSVPSLEDLGMSHGQMNADLVASHGQVTSTDGGYGKVASVDGGCKLNFSSASASNSLNRDKITLENTTTSTRGEGTVDSWICSSD